MPTMRPLYGGCPLLGGSVMGGSTVYQLHLYMYTYDYTGSSPLLSKFNFVFTYEGTSAKSEGNIIIDSNKLPNVHVHTCQATAALHQ